MDKLDTKDLRVDTFAASVPNAVTTVRIIHMPTQLVVEGDTKDDPSLTRTTKALVERLTSLVEEHLQRNCK